MDTHTKSRIENNKKLKVYQNKKSKRKTCTKPGTIPDTYHMKINENELNK